MECGGLEDMHIMVDVSEEIGHLSCVGIFLALLGRQGLNSGQHAFEANTFIC